MVMKANEYKLGGYTIYELPYKVPDEKNVYKAIRNLYDVFRPGIGNRLELIDFMKKRHGIPDDVPAPIELQKKHGPGVQLSLEYSCDTALAPMKYDLNHTILDFHNATQPRKGKDVYSHMWGYVATPRTISTNYHTHEKFSPFEDSWITTWTWTYYLEIPDKISGDEAKLFFSTNEDDRDALKILPKRHHLYIFNGNIPHKPALAPNATNNRTVLAGNVYIPFIDKVLM